MEHEAAVGDLRSRSGRLPRTLMRSHHRHRIGPGASGVCQPQVQTQVVRKFRPLRSVLGTASVILCWPHGGCSTTWCRSHRERGTCRPLLGVGLYGCGNHWTSVRAAVRSRSTVHKPLSAERFSEDGSAVNGRPDAVAVMPLHHSQILVAELVRNLLDGHAGIRHQRCGGVTLFIRCPATEHGADRDEFESAATSCRVGRSVGRRREDKILRIGPC